MCTNSFTLMNHKTFRHVSIEMDYSDEPSINEGLSSLYESSIDDDCSDPAKRRRRLIANWNESLGPTRPKGFTSANCRDSPGIIDALKCPVCLDIFWVRQLLFKKNLFNPAAVDKNTWRGGRLRQICRNAKRVLNLSKMNYYCRFRSK